MAERFDVTEQHQMMALTEGNRAREVMRVHFTAKPSGVTGTVDVPLNEYGAEAVARAILERVDAIDAVTGL